LDISGNSSIDQLTQQIGSDLLGGGGAFDTTDGKTFGTVLDNDAHDTFFHSVREFADATSQG
jgi:hypothetical protein